LRLKTRQAYLADSERVEVRKKKFTVAEVKPRGLDHAGDEFGLVLEVVTVMRGVT
jgi:hypothetical protein